MASLLARALAPVVVAAALVCGPTVSFAQQSPTTPVSRNWAGYVGSNAYYTGVSALIQTPAATPGFQLGQASAGSWVGIGGATSTDLIQAGVSVSTSGQQAQYSAWYEALPAASRTAPLQINGGDWIEIDIHELEWDLWQITIVDGQQVFQTALPYTSSHSSAEWIFEDPSVARGLIPLATVSGVNFARMTALANGNTATPAGLFPQPIVMIGSRGQTVAAPSPLGPAGDSFSVAPAP